MAFILPTLPIRWPRCLPCRRDDQVARERLDTDAVYGLVTEGRARELDLDRVDELVPGLLQSLQGRVGVQVRAVASAVALDCVGGCRQRRGAELADAGVQLLVALAQLRDARLSECVIRVGQDLG